MDITKYCFLPWSASPLLQQFSCCFFVCLSVFSFVVNNWKVSSVRSSSGDWMIYWRISIFLPWINCSDASLDFKIEQLLNTSPKVGISSRSSICLVFQELTNKETHPVHYMYASKNGSDGQGANYKIMLVSKYLQTVNMSVYSLTVGP